MIRRVSIRSEDRPCTRSPIVVDPKEAPFSIEGIAVGLVRNGKSW